jgi:hypothetical protein
MSFLGRKTAGTTLYPVAAPSSGTTFPHSMGWAQEGATILILGCLSQRRLPVRPPGSAEADQASVDDDVEQFLRILQLRPVNHDANRHIFPQSNE